MDVAIKVFLFMLLGYFMNFVFAIAVMDDFPFKDVNVVIRTLIAILCFVPFGLVFMPLIFVLVTTPLFVAVFTYAFIRYGKTPGEVIDEL